jgi:hypothetical protein
LIINHNITIAAHDETYIDFDYSSVDDGKYFSFVLEANNTLDHTLMINDGVNEELEIYDFHSHFNYTSRSNGECIKILEDTFIIIKNHNNEDTEFTLSFEDVTQYYVEEDNVSNGSYWIIAFIVIICAIVSACICIGAYYLFRNVRRHKYEII